MNKRRFETTIHQSSKVLLLQGKLQTISLVLKTCKKDVQRRKWFEGKKNRFFKLFLKGSAIDEIPVILISTLLVPVIDIDAHVLGGDVVEYLYPVKGTEWYNDWEVQMLSSVPALQNVMSTVQ